MAINKSLSFEDANLDSRTLVTSREKLYKDFDLTFAIKETGDIYKKTDAGAVRQAVKNIIQTNFGEKPFNPYFGGDIRSMLFETRDQESIYLLETSLELQLENNIRNSISTYEPRAELLNVEINAGFNNNTLAAIITFKIKSTEEVVTLETNLSRIK